MNKIFDTEIARIEAIRTAVNKRLSIIEFAANHAIAKGISFNEAMSVAVNALEIEPMSYDPDILCQEICIELGEWFSSRV